MKKDELIDFYKIIPKSMKTKYNNPNYEKHHINIPFRMLIVGNSGSGKSTLVLEMIHRMNNTFGNIILVCKNEDEPLYKFLRSKIPETHLQIYEGIENVPSMGDLDPDLQHLIIFDDLVLEKNQSAIEEYFIRGRKIAKGVSMMYLTQSYFKTPKTIRLQCNYIILKKLSSTRDLNMIMSDFSLGVDKKVLTNLYKFATEDKKNFLLIDIDKELSHRFRHNFLCILEAKEK